MPAAVSNEELVRQLHGRNGEEAARTLYLRLAPELYGFAASRLGDRGLAEETVQDVFVQIWRHAEQYDPTLGEVRTWIYGITRNAVLDAERRRGRRPRAAAGRPEDQADLDEPIERALLRWQVQLAFDRLTPAHRAIVHQTQVQGLKLREIAERTGVPLGTVKSRAHYALENLRLALEELGVTR